MWYPPFDVIGQVVGSYRIVRLLGEGGMGQVFLAEHVMLGRKAAVKMLHTELTASDELVARFFNEAKATTVINHPCIVPVFDFGRAANGAAFFVMDFLDGETLGSRLRRGGRLSSEVTVAYMQQVVGALAMAHDIGIVHRDLKPDNLFLTADPTLPCRVRVRLLDFGIAKLREESAVRTKTDALMGTPAYMSPEQCRGAGGVDHRSDIYSLGCIMFEMVVGRPPFVGQGSGDFITAHMAQEPASPRSFDPAIPEVLERVILRCLAKRAEHRFQSMRELEAELDRMPRYSAAPRDVASWSGVDAGRVHSPALALPSMTQPSPPEAARARLTTMGGAASEVGARAATPRSRRNGLVAVGIVAVAAVGIGIVGLSGEQSSPRPAAAISADGSTAELNSGAPTPAVVVDAGFVADHPASPDAGVATKPVAEPSPRPTRTERTRRVTGQRPASTTPGDSVVLPDEFK